MALAKRKFREMVFQVLYSMDVQDQEDIDLITFFMKQLKTSKKNVIAAIEYAQNILQKAEEIDKKIETASISYRFERIGQVEKNILRLSVYEVLFDKEISHEVAISEAIRLCRKFATAEGADFVNAIIDHIHKKDTQIENDQD